MLKSLRPIVALDEAYYFEIRDINILKQSIKNKGGDGVANDRAKNNAYNHCTRAEISSLSSNKLSMLQMKKNLDVCEKLKKLRLLYRL